MDIHSSTICIQWDSTQQWKRTSYVCIEQECMHSTYLKKEKDKNQLCDPIYSQLKNRKKKNESLEVEVRIVVTLQGEVGWEET